MHTDLRGGRRLSSSSSSRNSSNSSIIIIPPSLASTFSTPPPLIIKENDYANRKRPRALRLGSLTSKLTMVSPSPTKLWFNCN
eukprot:1131934-Pelagomonas_calceolata.AAC.1